MWSSSPSADKSINTSYVCTLPSLTDRVLSRCSASYIIVTKATRFFLSSLLLTELWQAPACTPGRVNNTFSHFTFLMCLRCGFRACTADFNKADKSINHTSAKTQHHLWAVLGVSPLLCFPFEAQKTLKIVVQVVHMLTMFHNVWAFCPKVKQQKKEVWRVSNTTRRITDNSFKF